MFDEDDLLPLSALQHLIFCERQCALIHIEQVWEDNRLTVEGSLLHRRVDARGSETRDDMRIARGVRLRSLRLGLSGKADVVEYHRVTGGTPSRKSEARATWVPLPGLSGLWRPFPIEYKRGRPKPDRCDEVQLCAQAMCLEEMQSVQVPCGALFYGRTRRRLNVSFDVDLRRQTEYAAERLHRLFASRQTPRPQYSKKCDRCSLVSFCLPRISARGRSAVRYLNDELSHQGGEE